MGRGAWGTGHGAWGVGRRGNHESLITNRCYVFPMSLTTKVLIALVAGLGLGLLVSGSGNPALVNAVRWIEPLGTLFINAIRMTVIPLVVGSLVAGIASAPD